MVYNGYQDYFEKPVVISVATTGGFHGKEANPNLPEQPEEIVEDVKACREAGASIVHVHGRDEDGEDTKDPAKFQEIRDLLAEEVPDILVNFTTGGEEPREELIAPVREVDPAPDLATIDLGPLNVSHTTTSLNPRDQNVEFAELMNERGVKPELESFNMGHVDEAEYLIEEGLIEDPYWFTIIFGMQSGTLPKPRNVINFVDNLPENSEWQAMAIGKHQLPLTTIAMSMGGHVRVGMEDNVYYKKGELAESNAQLVRRTARIAEELNRPVATPDETRDLLGL